MGLQLLDVGDGLLVLLLGKRIDRPQLLAPALQPLQAVAQLLTVLLGQRVARRLRLQSELARDLVQLSLDFGGAVPGLLSGHLGARHRLAAGTQTCLQLRFLLRADAQGGCYLLPRGGPSSKLFGQDVPACLDRRARRLQRLRGALAIPRQQLVSCGAGAQTGDRP